MEEAIRELIRKVKNLERRLSEMQAGGIPGLNASMITDVRLLIFEQTIASEDFDNNNIPSGWQWATSPFITPPNTIFQNSTIIRISGYTSAFRSFLYRTLPENTNFVSALVGLDTSVTQYTGIRIDDGTDNNYIEFVLWFVRTSTEPQNRFYMRQRTNGGTVSETEITAFRMAVVPNFTYLTAQILGTRWSSWYIVSMLINVHSVSRGVSSATVSWTPSRVGWVSGGSSAYSWHSFWCDMVRFSM